MPVINKDDKAKAKRYLTSVTAALKAVANGDDEDALQTLQDMVDESDASFEDTLDATETLAGLITASEDAVLDEDEEEEVEDEEEEVEETARLRTKASTKKRVDTRATFLDTALASLDEDEEEYDDEEDEDFEEEEEVASDEDDADLDEEDEEEEDEEELVEESTVSKRVAQKRQARASTAASVATPKAKKKAADSKGRI